MSYINGIKNGCSVKKLFIVVNVDWFFLSHRLPIALEALKRGYDVTICAIDTGKKKEIESYGLKFKPLPTSRSGTNAITELKVLLFLLNWYRREKPDIVHHVAMKPVTYGSIAAKCIGVKRVVNALSGLGFLFINADKNKIIHSLLSRFFKFGFNNPNLRFILQNQDDLGMIKDLKILKDNQVFLIKGSGVSLSSFKYIIEPDTTSLKIVLPARMLWDKGIREFIQAARILKSSYGNKIIFILAGPVDTENKATITESQLLDWNTEGIVSWIGFQTNMIQVLNEAHIVVLPSYREGLPKSLIEACAIGRPIVTTDVPGCREVVVNGVNGFLVPDKNEEALAKAIEKLILDKALRIKMGKEGRIIAEQSFSLESVIEQTFAIYEN
jgi:glycosyltransferase involved in cell wall biosynthesis